MIFWKEQFLPSQTQIRVLEKLENFSVVESPLRVLELQSHLRVTKYWTENTMTAMNKFVLPFQQCTVQHP